MEANLHLDQAPKEPGMTPRLHRDVAESRTDIEVLATVVAEKAVPIEFVAVTIAELRKALEGNCSPLLTARG
jgi:hypothetical protein